MNKLDEIKKQTESEGPYLAVVSEERSNEIKELRSKLDEYIPLVKAMTANNSGYKKDGAYQKMLKEINDLERELKNKVAGETNAIEASVRGEAAVYHH